MRTWCALRSAGGAHPEHCMVQDAIILLSGKLQNAACLPETLVACIGAVRTGGNS